MIKLVNLLELGINKGITREELFNYVNHEIPSDIWNNNSEFFKEYEEILKKYIPNHSITIYDLNKNQTNSFYYELKNLIKKYE